jgi:outer membrane biosynthesis protein TonB
MYLYPDGTVSDITLINQKENGALDELTMETVQMSYAKYPRPQQKTLIRLHTRIMRVKNTY